MKQKILVRVLLGCLGLVLVNCQYGQEDYRTRNVRLLDSLLEQMKQEGDLAISGFAGSKREIKNDQKYIAFLNDFLDPRSDMAHLSPKIKKLRGKRASFDSLQLGSITKLETRLPLTGNLNIFLRLTLYHDSIIYKQAYLSTQSSTICQNRGEEFPLLQDFIYLKEHCLPHMRFYVAPYRDGSFLMAHADETRHPGFSSDGKVYLFPADSSELNAQTYAYCTAYDVFNVPDLMRQYVQEKRIDLLYHLLYSPNSLLCIHAMEALTYLEADLGLRIPDTYRIRMREVAGMNIPLSIRRSDLIYRGVPYYRVRRSRRAIILKYRRNLRTAGNGGKWI